MSRVFLMKWYHFSVEYFEDLRNINHCEFLTMRNEGGKYILENNLRTWSELKREKSLLALKEKNDEKTGEKTGDKTEDKEESKEEGDAVKVNGSSKDGSKLDRVLRTNLPLASPAASSSPVEVRRRWGGCPDGCNHDKGFRIQQTLADLVKRDSHASEHAAPAPDETSKDCALEAAARACPAADGDGHHEPTAHGIENPSFNGNGNTSNSSASLAARRPAAKRFQSTGSTEESSEMDGPTIDITKARDEVVSSPDGTPSFISVDDRLRAQLKSPNLPPPKPLARRLGRDFGGTYSGQSSAVNTDDDSSEDEILVDRIARLKVANGLLPHHRSQTRDQSGMGRGARANRLGDAPHSSDGETDLENNMVDDALGGTALERATTAEIEQAEAEDRGIQGSVY